MRKVGLLSFRDLYSWRGRIHAAHYRAIEARIWMWGLPFFALLGMSGYYIHKIGGLFEIFTVGHSLPGLGLLLGGAMALLYVLGVFIPALLAAKIRRLHDWGYSGWWLLPLMLGLFFIEYAIFWGLTYPVGYSPQVEEMIGFGVVMNLFLLMLMLRGSRQHANKFGRVPRTRMTWAAQYGGWVPVVVVSLFTFLGVAGDVRVAYDGRAMAIQGAVADIQAMQGRIGQAYEIARARHNNTQLRMDDLIETADADDNLLKEDEMPANLEMQIFQARHVANLGLEVCSGLMGTCDQWVAYVTDIKPSLDVALALDELVDGTPNPNAGNVRYFAQKGALVILYRLNVTEAI